MYPETEDEARGLCRGIIYDLHEIAEHGCRCCSDCCFVDHTKHAELRDSIHKLVKYLNANSGIRLML